MTDAEDTMSVQTLKSDEVEADTFVDLHVTCAELWDNRNDKMRQIGRLKDGDGDHIRFISWEASEQPELEEGHSYAIRDAQVIPDREENKSIIFRSRTEIDDAAAPVGETTDADDAGEASPASPNGPTCAYCDEAMPESAYNEGPGAPEIGWEYYECPHCDRKMRADAV